MLLFSCGNNAQINESGNNLEEIKIGTQTWATKNLDVSTFKNGDAIPEAKTNEEWIAAGDSDKPACCYYNNDLENGKKYGKLYNWYAVNDPRGLAPKGWHVPTDAEWKTLIDYLGGEQVAGTKMKNTSGWNEWNGKTGNGTNQSGLSVSPGGYRFDSGVFHSIGFASIWWTSSESGTGSALASVINYSDGSAHKGNNLKSFGFSVCCLRD